MRKHSKEPDLATLLALYNQFSPERDVAAQLDQARLAEVLGNQQYAQELGYPSMGAMQAGLQNEDRDMRTALYADSRKQADLNSQLNAAQAGGRMDVLQQILQQFHPEWGAPPPPPQPKPKKGILDFFK